MEQEELDSDWYLAAVLWLQVDSVAWITNFITL